MSTRLLFPSSQLLTFFFATALCAFEFSEFYARIDPFNVARIIFGLSPLMLYLALTGSSIETRVRGRKVRGWIPLLLVCGFFVVEFYVYGVPALSGGREDFTGFPVLHVAFYSMLMFGNIYAASSARVSGMLSIFALTVAISILLLSRQAFVFASVVLFYGLMLRRKIKTRSTVILLISIIVVFELVGNLRQTIAGDFVDDYIHIVGGATELGMAIPSQLFWIWAYLASPIYNLAFNLDQFALLGTSRDLSLPEVASFFATPDTLNKIMSIPKREIDLVVDHFNVGTGYAMMARQFGVLGIFFVSCFLVLCHALWLRFFTGVRRTEYIIFVSACSVIFVFDNPFLRAEFVFMLPLMVLREILALRPSGGGHRASPLRGPANRPEGESSRLVMQPTTGINPPNRVAVAMSCYNGSAFVEPQVASIFAQTLPISTLSVWDDCSTDDTWIRVQHLAARHPAMRVRRGERNRGVNQGFQAALDQCPASDWYAFSDQDDLWPTDRIERFVAHASTCDASVPLLLVCQFATFRDVLPEPGQPTSRTLLAHGDARTPWACSLLAANPLYGCCFFFNHALRVLVGTIPQGRTTHDYWVALLAAHFGRIEVLDFVGTYYRQHAANASFGAPRRGLLPKLGNVRRSLQADRRSRADMVPLIQGLLQHPRSAELEPHDRSVLEQALAAYQRGGWALVEFQRRQGAWARRPTHNALRVVSCLSDGLIARG